jgi:hypothetical protein
VYIKRGYPHAFHSSYLAYLSLLLLQSLFFNYLTSRHPLSTSSLMSALCLLLLVAQPLLSHTWILWQDLAGVVGCDTYLLLWEPLRITFLRSSFPSLCLSTLSPLYGMNLGTLLPLLGEKSVTTPFLFPLSSVSFVLCFLCMSLVSVPFVPSLLSLFLCRSPFVLDTSHCHSHVP